MKEKFIQSTIILSVGGILTKILSLIIRIIATRIVGEYGIGLFMIVLPTYNLFITIATFSLPLAISKLVSEEKTSSKSLIFSILPISIILNLIIIIIIFITAPFISETLLKNKDLYFPIILIGLTLPFISISGIIKGYFFGKQNMIPSVISNLIEQIVRIITIIILTPFLLKKGIVYAVSGLVAFNMISEFASIIVLIFFLPKNIVIRKKDLIIKKQNIKNIIHIGLPNTLSRLVSSLSLFLEPIIITFVLVKLGNSVEYITSEYGIINGYVIPIITMPSFITSSISSSLLPIISKYNSLGKKEKIKSKFHQALFLCTMIGIIFTIIIYFFSPLLLKYIFKTTLGIKYLKIGAILFLLSYLQAPIQALFQGMDESGIILKITIISLVVKTFFLLTLSFLNISLYSILISEFIKYLIITIYEFNKIKKMI